MVEAIVEEMVGDISLVKIEETTRGHLNHSVRYAGNLAMKHGNVITGTIKVTQAHAFLSTTIPVIV